MRVDILAELWAGPAQCSSTEWLMQPNLHVDLVRTHIADPIGTGLEGVIVVECNQLGWWV